MYDNMLNIQLNLFPGGVRKALTLSYDDGQVYDLKLAALFDKYGIKGTFCLNSMNLNKEGYLKNENLVKELAGHEIAVHTKNHPFLTSLPDQGIMCEVMEDKAYLEHAVRYPVRGMSYPYGRYDNHLIPLLQSCGMEYSRTVENTRGFDIPENFMKWHPTAHHNDDVKTLFFEFMGRDDPKLSLFYLWGHSYEFHRENNWNVIEDFCRMAGRKKDIWYATNIEICSYCRAMNSLILSADGHMVQNMSAMDVWCTVEGERVCIPGGGIYRR